MIDWISNNQDVIISLLGSLLLLLSGSLISALIWIARTALMSDSKADELTSRLYRHEIACENRVKEQTREMDHVKREIRSVASAVNRTEGKVDTILQNAK